MQRIDVPLALAVAVLVAGCNSSGGVHSARSASSAGRSTSVTTKPNGVAPGTLMVVDRESSAVSVIAPGASTGYDVEVGHAPVSIAIAPVGTPRAGTAYVTTQAGISVITPGAHTARTVTGVEFDDIALAAEHDETIAIAPAGTPAAGTVYATDTQANALQILAPGAAALRSVPTGDGPGAVAVVPAGTDGAGTVVVANEGDGTITLFQPDGSEPRAVRVGAEPNSIAVAPAGTAHAGAVYVTVHGGQAVLAPGATATTLIPYSGLDGSIATVAPAGTPKAGDLYIADGYADTLTVFAPDGTLAQKIDSIVGAGPAVIAPAATPRAGTVYVPDYQASTLAVLAPGSDLAAKYPVGTTPEFAVIAPAGTPQAGTVYTADADGDTVSVLGPSARSAYQVKVGKAPGALAIFG